jgi:hypothetical protein
LFISQILFDDGYYSFKNAKGDLLLGAKLLLPPAKLLRGSSFPIADMQSELGVRNGMGLETMNDPSANIRSALFTVALVMTATAIAAWMIWGEH